MSKQQPKAAKATGSGSGQKHFAPSTKGMTNKVKQNPNLSSSKHTQLQGKVHNCSWSRLGLRVVPAEAKTQLLVSLGGALTAGCKLGRDFVTGSNSVSKLLESGNLSSVCVARDAPYQLHNHIVEAALARGVPVVILPKLVEELAALLKLKSATCLGIPVRVKAEGVDSSSAEALVRDSARDALSDFIATLSNKPTET